MYKIIDSNGNTLQDHFTTKGEAQAFAKCLKEKTKVVSDTKEQLAKSLEKRQELPTDSKGFYLDEQQASGSYVLCNTLALNLVHEVLHSKAKITSNCLSAGFAVRCKGSAVDLQNTVYDALQSAGINCYCSGTAVMIDWIRVDIRAGFISTQCTFDEYERCMRWLGTHG
jgi:hypothetical protein